MSSISAYTEGKQRRFSVTVGRKTARGFTSAIAALKKGVEMAMHEDPRAPELLTGKSFESQVGIVFGAETRNRFLQPQENL